MTPKALSREIKVLKSETGEEYVICEVCEMPCYGGYLTHIPCGGLKILTKENK